MSLEFILRHTLNILAPIIVLMAAVPAQAQTTWRGLEVAPENRCSTYSSGDYSYRSSLEDDLVAMLGGVYSPYTGEWFDSKARTDIEHIVARSEAHDSGLCSASVEARREFAADPLNLTLADPGTNRDRKSDKDAADWLPDLNRCWFANRVLKVKLKYRLSVDRDEAEALDAVLAGCMNFALVVHPPDAGPLSGIYVSASVREALLIVQDYHGATISLSLPYELDPSGELVPGVWGYSTERIEEAPAGYERFFPDATPVLLPEPQ